MSKIQAQKQHQGYIAKPIQRMCSNCKFFKSDFISNDYGYNAEVSMRCTYSHIEFAVKKQAKCDYHDFKTTENEQPNN
jgi:hypothetical protein